MSRRVVPDNPPGTRAADAPVAAEAAPAVRDYLEFYGRELVVHVAEEEDVLLPLAGHVDPEGAARILAEHRELHASTAALRDALAEGADLRPAARDLGDLLHDHVRFEERAFFMKVQAGLSRAALEELQRALRTGGACPTA
jgi:hypothetical protein